MGMRQVPRPKDEAEDVGEGEGEDVEGERTISQHPESDQVVT